MKILLLPIILFSIFTTAAGMKAGEATQPKAGTQLQVRTVYLTSYDELIEKIAQAERCNFPENERLEISDEFRFPNESEVHGYLLMDLDSDGSDELLLGLNSVDEADPNESWDSIIYDIFTMKKAACSTLSPAAHAADIISAKTVCWQTKAQTEQRTPPENTILTKPEILTS